MKGYASFIIIIATLLISFQGIAQTGGMVKDSTFWSIYTRAFWSQNEIIEKGYSYMINGDTTYNGTLYKKLYTGRTWTRFSRETGSNVDYELAGLLRQDSSRVYFVNFDFEACLDWPFIDSFPYLQENLLYDFDLDIGDTFRSVPTIRTVTLIDSIQLVDNSWRKRFYSSSHEIVWIENIGHIDGLFSNYKRYLGCATFMHCFKQNGKYLIGGVNCDSLPAGVHNLAITDKISIYPNPASDHIFFDIPEHLKGPSLSGILTDMAGKNILQIVLSDGFADISDLSPGIYLLQFSNNTELLYTIKIYKH